MLRRSLEAAARLADEGIDVEIVDPVTLNPFDFDTIAASVRKTGACIVVEEAPRTLGVGAEIGARLMEEAFGYLDRPLVRLAIPDVPVPTAEHLVDSLVPSVDDIVAATRTLVGRAMSAPIRVPRVGQSMTEATLVSWERSTGDVVAAGDVVATIETDKTEIEVEAPGAGVLGALRANEGDVCAVGTLLAYVLDPGEPEPLATGMASAPTVALEPEPSISAPPEARRPVSPRARRIAAELGVDVDGLAGTGADGVVTEADVRGRGRRCARARTPIVAVRSPAANGRRPATSRRRGRVRRTSPRWSTSTSRSSSNSATIGRASRSTMWSSTRSGARCAPCPSATCASTPTATG